MVVFIPPMLAKPADHDLSFTIAEMKNAWADEKLDGFRMILNNAGSGSYAYSRQGHPFMLTNKFMGALSQLPEGIYDGELIYNRGVGVYDRRELHRYMGTAESMPELLHYAVFDVLEVEGHDLKPEPLAVRKAVIQYMLTNDRDAPVFGLLGGLVTDANLDAACGMFRIREGLVIKDGASPYIPGKRVNFWRKVINPDYGKVIQ